MKAENAFIHGVHRYLPSERTLYRMKNHNPYAGGVADCWYSARKDLWIEYKFITLPKRDSTLIVPGLSPLQMDWCVTRAREGRNIRVIVGCQQGGVVLPDPIEWAGIPRAAFIARLKTRRDIAQYIAQEVS